jgi:phosphatidylethanolamine-binding protein (PEBP) family uncharacterized protein
MKIKFLYLILLFTLLVSACSPSSAATNQSYELPVAQTEEILLTVAQDQDAYPEQETTSFTLSSPDVNEAGMLPTEYTCDGANATLPLTWSGAPAETESFAVVMHHVPGQGDTHWYWVLYDIPADVTGLSKNSTGIGTLGSNSVNGNTAYAPPCSQGPGEKEYVYTVYALSTTPQLSVPASQVSREVLLEAIQDITLASSELTVTYNRTDVSQEQESVVGLEQGEVGNGRTPPTEAIATCNAISEGDVCEFTSSKGVETGVCEMVQEQLACSPERGPSNGERSGEPANQTDGRPVNENNASYNIEQAISDRAQQMTIAFDALAFLTGDVGSNSFFPPGKVADFWGFQYLRDNDPSQMGHAGDFLTSAAINTLNILTQEQRAELITLAENQVEAINEYGMLRFVLIDAFNRLLHDELPAGTTGLDKDAVITYSAELYRLDGEISYDRAQVMGGLINSLDETQLAYLDAMVGQGMLEWPDVEEPASLRDLDRDVKVAVMTYAADMFSWYAGSVEADVYFCPERHGTYFGSFYLKDAPAMENPSYAIPTELTGDMGEALLATLTTDQAQLITSLVDIQRPNLQGIVAVRQSVSYELRRFMAGETADRETVLSLMEEYGALDGEIVYNFAQNFAQVNQTLTTEQQTQLMSFRLEMLGDMIYPTGAYLYSQSIAMPEIPNTDFIFE